MPPNKEDMEISLFDLFDNISSLELFEFEARNEIDPMTVSKKLTENNVSGRT